MILQTSAGLQLRLRVRSCLSDLLTEGRFLSTLQKHYVNLIQLYYSSTTMQYKGKHKGKRNTGRDRLLHEKQGGTALNVFHRSVLNTANQLR